MMIKPKAGDLITPHISNYMGFYEGEIELKVVDVGRELVKFTNIYGTGTDSIGHKAFHKRFKVVTPVSLENK